MKKLAFGLLLAAAAVGFTAPANAQGFWFGVGPFGFGVGGTPYDGYDADWSAPVYRPYTYSYPTTYSYDYPADYAYAPSYGAYTYYPYGEQYTYAPGYTYTRYGYTPDLPSRSYAYTPRTQVYRTRTAVRYTTAARHHRRAHVARTHVRDVRFVHRAGLTAQASVPVHHIRHHHRGDNVRHK